MGNLFVEVRHDFVRSLFETSADYDLERINGVFAALEEEAHGRLSAEGVGEDHMILRRAIDIRNYGQISGGVLLPVPPGTIDRSTVDALFKSFHEYQMKEFGYAIPRAMAELELVNARVSAEGDRAIEIDPVYPLPEGAAPEPRGERNVFYEGHEWLPTPVFDRTTLPIGFEVQGPAIIEQNDTTTLLVPGSRARVEKGLNLICTVS